MKTKRMKENDSGKAISNNRKRLLVTDTPFAIKEAYVKLRTNLMFCMTEDKERPCKVFAVTSAKPSEGKSLTAANIAISFAMLGKRTLLIDADLRKPTQRRLWRGEVNTGLCDFLARICPLEFAKVENLPLSLIFTGTIPPNPSELLASNRMRQFVEHCASQFEYIIIDTPPINTVADAQIVSTFVDGMIVVAMSGNTTTEELNSAIFSVQRAGGNICGVVLNDLNMRSMKYSYRYKYSDRYGYKSKYYYRYGYKNKYSYRYGSKYGYKYGASDTNEEGEGA